MDDKALITSREERLFIGSLQEKKQNGVLSKDDLAEMRDYFYFKRTILKRCLNIPPRLEDLCPGDTADGGAKDGGIISRALYNFQRMVSDREMARLCSLEKYIAGNYFAGDFSMAASKIRSAISSFDHSRFRRYKNRIGARTFLDIAYRVRADGPGTQDDIRGIDIYIQNGDKRISVKKVGLLIAVILADPRKKEIIRDLLAKSYPGLEKVLDIKIINDFINVRPPVKDNIRFAFDSGEGISVSCPSDIVDFITDEIMLFLTSTFIGRNIVFKEICENIEQVIKDREQQTEPEI